MVGKTSTNNEKIVGPLTQKDLKEELANQKINIMFMDDHDVIIFSEVP